MLHRFAKFLAGITFLLLIAGALVTSTGSGLAVPDWPLSFGKLFPPMVGGVLFEHGHRLIAGLVALLTLVFCVTLLLQEKRAWVRRLALAAFAIVCVQAALGGLTVLLHLPPTVSIAHAGLAEVFFSLTISLALVTSPTWPRPSGIPLESGDVLALKVLSCSAAAIVYLQILLGAVIRHTNSGVPFHIIGAMAALFITGRLFYFVNTGYGDQPYLRKPAAAALHASGSQIFLGMASWIAKIKNAGAVPASAAKVWLSTIHLAVGAVVLASCIILAWRVFKLAAESPIKEEVAA